MIRRSRLRLRRRLAALGALFAVAGVTLMVTGAGDGPGGQERSTLFDELAPLLASGGGTAESPEQRAERERAGLPLPLSRAVAQVFLVGFEGTNGSSPVLRRLPARGWGAVMIDPANYAGPSRLRGLLRAIEDVARGARQVPPLVVALQQGGAVRTVTFAGPRAQAELGATGTPAQARASAQVAGRILRGLGVHAVTGPVADLSVTGGPADGVGFGDDPARVARFVAAAVDGWRTARIAPIVGRFPGEGAASQDPLEGPATVGLSFEEILERDVRPFAAAVGRAPAIELSAASYVAWDGVTPATLLPDAVRLLRGRLGFGGVIVSADLLAASTATGESIGRTAVRALAAGADVLQLPGPAEAQEEAYRAVLAAVRRGEVPRERLAEAVRRVLALKRLYRVTG